MLARFVVSKCKISHRKIVPRVFFLVHSSRGVTSSNGFGCYNASGNFYFSRTDKAIVSTALNHSSVGNVSPTIVHSIHAGCFSVLVALRHPAPKGFPLSQLEAMRKSMLGMSK